MDEKTPSETDFLEKLCWWTEIWRKHYALCDALEEELGTIEGEQRVPFPNVFGEAVERLLRDFFPVAVDPQAKDFHLPESPEEQDALVVLLFERKAARNATKMARFMEQRHCSRLLGRVVALATLRAYPIRLSHFFQSDNRFKLWATATLSALVVTRISLQKDLTLKRLLREASGGNCGPFQKLLCELPPHVFSVLSNMNPEKACIGLACEEIEAIFQRLGGSLPIGWDRESVVPGAGTSPITLVIQDLKRFQLKEQGLRLSYGQLLPDASSPLGATASEVAERGRSILRDSPLRPEDLLFREEARHNLEERLRAARLSETEMAIVELKCQNPGLKDTEVARMLRRPVDIIYQLKHRIRGKFRRVGLAP